MKTSLLALALLFTALSFGQAPTPAPQPITVGSVLTDPTNIPVWAWLAANVADAKTDWHLTVGGKVYTFTPAQRLGIAGGVTGAALFLRTYFPNNKALRTITSIGLGVASAYMGGKALASTYNQQAASPVVAAAATSQTQALAVSFRFRR